MSQARGGSERGGETRRGVSPDSDGRDRLGEFPVTATGAAVVRVTVAVRRFKTVERESAQTGLTSADSAPSANAESRSARWRAFTRRRPHLGGAVCPLSAPADA